MQLYDSYYHIQGLSQYLETGCPKLAIVKFWGVQILKGDHNILRFQPYIFINRSIKIRHDFRIQCLWDNMLEINILRDTSQNHFGCTEGCLLTVRVSKKTLRHPAG